MDINSRLMSWIYFSFFFCITYFSATINMRQIEPITSNGKCIGVVVFADFKTMTTHFYFS